MTFFLRTAGRSRTRSSASTPLTRLFLEELESRLVPAYGLSGNAWPAPHRARGHEGEGVFGMQLSCVLHALDEPLVEACGQRADSAFSRAGTKSVRHLQAPPALMNSLIASSWVR